MTNCRSEPDPRRAFSVFRYPGRLCTSALHRRRCRAYFDAYSGEIVPRISIRSGVAVQRSMLPAKGSKTVSCSNVMRSIDSSPAPPSGSMRKPGQRAFGLRQIGKIEEISLFGRVRVDIENFRFFVVIDGVFRRDEANAEPVGRTAVLHDEETSCCGPRASDCRCRCGFRRATAY